jgi:threonine dehydrogenase-like Zn-dependent dehydrogenase
VATVVNALGDPAHFGGTRVAIIGCGSLGLLAVIVSRRWGASFVAAGDINATAWRWLAISEQLAWTMAADEEVRSGTGHGGSDVTRELALSLADRGAGVKLVGLHSPSAQST